MKNYKITRHSTTAHVSINADGVVLVKICGPITGPSLLYFKAEIVRSSGAYVRAFVADYSCASVAVDGAQLDAVLEGDIDQPAAMPAALIVSVLDVALFAGHAARQALRGVVRQVFTEREPALRWARLYAAVQG